MTKKIFITYSWDSEDHKSWVSKLAHELEAFRELHVTCDIFDLDNESDRFFFMERAVSEADKIIVVTTKKYKSKADNRQGGVGIETYLTTARHWEESEGGTSSNIIVIQREKFSTPRYLQGKFYIDFSVDSLYQKSFSYLIKTLKGSARTPRPPKTLSFDTHDRNYSFTRAEDILRLKHAKRTALIGSDEGTDFSGANKIKFELWETRSPRVDKFLMLFNNITITQTIQRVCEVAVRKEILLDHLIVLRPSKGEEGLIQKLFTQANMQCKIEELTYSEYIWNYCIDEELRNTETIHNYKFYTDQTLSKVDDSSIENSAVEYLAHALTSDSNVAAHLVVATGGMGKSTLCHQLVSKIRVASDNQRTVVLIKAESIRNGLSEELLSNAEINSVYDLYALYANVIGIDEKFERVQFELSLLCGNLIVIVDGLDELSTILQERFNVNDFLKSIHASQLQLGKSKVLLTSRNVNLDDLDSLKNNEISTYELLGFDEVTRQKYVRKRFKSYSDQPEVIDKVNRVITELANLAKDQRVVPFFVDIASTIFEDQLQNQEPISFEVSEEEKGYISNSSLTDVIVFSVIKRECLRHIDLPIKDIVNLLCELTVESGEFISKDLLRERLAIYYDERSHDLLSKMLVNPLLLIDGGAIRFRYEFLNSYFTSLYLMNEIIQDSISVEFTKCMSRQRTAEGTAIWDVRNYFVNNPEKLHSSTKLILAKAREKFQKGNLSSRESEQLKRAVSSLLALYAAVQNCSKSELASRIRDLFGVETSPDVQVKVERMYIYGDFPVMDFSNMEIWNSRFVKYTRFVESKFTNAHFAYCEFGECGGKYPSDTFKPSVFDQTCKLGDLSETFSNSLSLTAKNRSQCEVEFKKFLRSFYRGASFIDQKLNYIKFSDKIERLNRRNFDGLLKKGLIAEAIAKKDEIYYEISQLHRDRVFRFLNDNFLDTTIHSYIDYLSE